MAAALVGLNSSHYLVSVVAPGYGKTSLLSQWAGARGQEFVWVSVEKPDGGAVGR